MSNIIKNMWQTDRPILTAAWLELKLLVDVYDVVLFVLLFIYIQSIRFSINLRCDLIRMLRK